MKQRIFDLIGVLALVLIGGSMALPYFEDRSPPITIVSAAFEEDATRVGGTVHLFVNGIRNRICPAKVISFWVRIDEDGDVETRVQNPVLSASPIQELGPYTARLAKTLPLAVTPGWWVYEAQIIPDCAVDEPAIVQGLVPIYVTG